MQIKNLSSEMIDSRHVAAIASALIGHLTAQYDYVLLFL